MYIYSSQYFFCEIANIFAMKMINELDACLLDISGCIAYIAMISLIKIVFFQSLHSFFLHPDNQSYMQECRWLAEFRLKNRFAKRKTFSPKHAMGILFRKKFIFDRNICEWFYYNSCYSFNLLNKIRDVLIVFILR